MHPLSHPSPPPPSWPGWAYQCSWGSTICSQRQNPCCFIFWYAFLKACSPSEGSFLLFRHFCTDTHTLIRTYLISLLLQLKTMLFDHALGVISECKRKSGTPLPRPSQRCIAMYDNLGLNAIQYPKFSKNLQNKLFFN